MTPLELYYAGRLRDAIAGVTDQVRRSPTDLAARGFLCELLCFAGDLERADRQLDTLAQQDSSLAVGLALFRQLIRAEQARQQLFTEGRLPEFLTPPPPRVHQLLEASICIRDKQPEEAARLLGQADEQRPLLEGVCDDRPFTELRDMDDLTASVFEVLTPNGKYYWVPMESVESLEFHKRERPRDLLWRHAHMVVRDGPEGDVYLPALYPGSHAEADERICLGQMTDWRGAEGGPMRGVGQRMLLIGDEDRPFLELQRLSIQPRAV